MIGNNRQFTDHERRLVGSMLQHGTPEALDSLPKLERAEVAPWQCACGCASINFRIRGKPDPPPGVYAIADFVFGDENTLGGIFVFEKDGILSRVDLYGLAGEAPMARSRTGSAQADR